MSEEQSTSQGEVELKGKRNKKLRTYIIGQFITQEGLLELKNYKYKSGKYTYLDNVFNAYWEFVVKLVPQWVAPNLITFIGWVLIVISYTNMLRYDYTVEKDIPNYCFTLTAFCVWAYSTLDAIDGKQARRTKSSSPLGQLFDHGCDSFSTTFFILAAGQALKLQGFQIFSLFVSTQAAFWTASWKQYKTGILVTNVGQFGVTQAHIICTLAHLLTGIFGQQIWQISLLDIIPGFLTADISNEIIVWTLGLKLGGFIAYYFGGLIFLLSFFEFIRTTIGSKNKLQPIAQCFTMYLIVIFEFVWVQLSFYDDYRGLVLLNFGLLSSLIMCKVIISSVTKMQLQTFHRQIIPLIVGTIFMIICELTGLKSYMNLIFWLLFAVNLIVILKFLFTVVNQITKYLQIQCFSITKKHSIKNM